MTKQTVRHDDDIALPKTRLQQPAAPCRPPAGQRTDEWSWSRGAITFFYGLMNGPLESVCQRHGQQRKPRREVELLSLAGGETVNSQLDDYTYDSAEPYAAVRGSSTE